MGGGEVSERRGQGEGGDSEWLIGPHLRYGSSSIISEELMQ